MKRIFLFLAVALVACGGSGDGGNSITGPGRTSYVGTYTLAQINGSALPVVFYSNSAGSASYTSGSAVLRADGSYQQTLSDQITYTSGAQNPPETVYENGTYIVTGNQITFTIPADANGPALSYVGAVDAHTISYTFDGTSYVYRR